MSVDPLAEETPEWSPYAFCNNNPVRYIDPTGMSTEDPPSKGWNRFVGALKLIGGIAEASAGTAAGVGTAWTGVGAVVGGAVAVHGADVAVAGFMQLVSGEDTSSLTSKAIQTIGVSKGTADVIDSSISIVGSGAAGGVISNTKAAATVRVNTTSESGTISNTTKNTLKPGKFADKSLIANGKGRNFTSVERNAINEIGNNTGCHTCGTTTAGTKSGNWVLDHQPVSALIPDGSPQSLYPHCLSCSQSQGGTVSGIVRKLKN